MRPPRSQKEKDASRERTKRHYWADPELARKKAREQGAKRRAAGGENERILAWCNENRTRKRRIGWKFQGIDPDAAQAALEAHNGRCNLCGTDKAGGRWNSWHVDHCHKGGEVRGILCSNCNTGLSTVDKVGVEKVVEYLRGKAGTVTKAEVSPPSISGEVE